MRSGSLTIGVLSVLFTLALWCAFFFYKGKKPVKILMGFLSCVITVIGISAILLSLWLGGAFNKLLVKDIVTVDSPDGDYRLVFQQFGDPKWPFGKTDVRLTLKDKNGNKISGIDTYVSEDGANASEYNIKSVQWNDSSVVIILRASEMPDKEIELKYDE